MYPEDLHYTKQHEWVRVSGDVGVVGITDYAQKELGDIVYVDLPRVGTKVEQAKVMGSVESVKAVSDIYSPVSGEVIEINTALATAPEKLNESPHGDGWMVKIRLSVPAEIQGLLSAADYEKVRRRGGIRALSPGPIRSCAIYRSPISSGARCLQALGVDSLDALFAHLPEEVRLNRPLEIPPGKSEYEIVDYFRARGGECANGYASFLGRGRLSPLPARAGGHGGLPLRIPDFLHSLPGGNLTRHAHHDLRISNHDLPAHWHGSCQRVDVRRLYRRSRSGDDGHAIDRP